MATTVQKITLLSSRDITFRKLVFSQSQARIKADIWIEDLPDLVAEVASHSRLIAPKTSSGGIDRLAVEIRAGSAHPTKPQALGPANWAELREPYPMQRTDTREDA
ncbi:hypothetical protein NKH10_00395 [Mesorhizobium sp. M1340]|uniref:hypothetical protein n=1 Tax=unclassified Mesorhizobium TaxID=325217 RepID=UPI00333B5B5F